MEHGAVAQVADVSNWDLSTVSHRTWNGVRTSGGIGMQGHLCVKRGESPSFQTICAPLKVKGIYDR